MKREIEKKGIDGENHKISIEPKVDKGFLKVGYMKHHSHHNEDFKYEFIDKKDATAMILFNYDYSKFYLVKQFRPGAMENIWEIPAGILEEGLTPLENSLKEIAEETGYKKEDIIDIVELTQGYVSPGYSTESTILFAGRLRKDAVQGEKNCDENECIISEGFFSEEEAEKIGAFKDMKTSLAYYKFKSIPKKKIGVFGGTFDPVTNLHIRVALRAKEDFGLDKVIFEPVGDKYSYEDKSNVTSSNHRVNMLKLAVETEGDENIVIGSYDIDNSKFEGVCPTVEVLDYYKELYGNVEIYFICGTDNLKSMDRWQNSEKLLFENKIVVFQRNSDNIFQDIVFKNTTLLKHRKNIVPMYEIVENNVSSSKIKEAVTAGMSIAGMVPTAVRRYMKENGLYGAK